MRQAALILGVLGLGLLVGCGKKEQSYSVEYRVTGSAQAVDIAYSTDAVNRETAMKAALPWNRTVTMPSGATVAMVIQVGTDGGSVNGEVMVNGQSIKECQSSGASSSAQCGAGLLP